jgi:transcriptional regulator with XRE-family HTH domain
MPAMRGRPTNRTRTPFGARLVAARMERGLTQQMLAEKLGVNRTLITYYERASRSPKIGFVQECAATLRVPVEELLGFAPMRPGKRGPKNEVDHLCADLRKLPTRKRRLAVRLFRSQLPELE